MTLIGKTAQQEGFLLRRFVLGSKKVDLTEALFGFVLGSAFAHVPAIRAEYTFVVGLEFLKASLLDGFTGLPGQL